MSANATDQNVIAGEPESLKWLDVFEPVSSIDKNKREQEKKEIAQNETLQQAKDAFEQKLRKVLGDVPEAD